MHKILVLLSVTALVLCSLHKDYDYMLYQFSFGMALLCIPLSYYITKRLGLLVGVFSAYCGIYSVYICSNAHGRNIGLPGAFQINLAVNTTFTFLVCTLLIFGVLHIPRTWRRALRDAIPIYTTINALYALHSWKTGFRLWGGNGSTSFLDYAGMSATLMALGAAFLIPVSTDTRAARYLKYLGLLITVGGIAVSKSAIPFGVLGLIIASRMVGIRSLIGSLIGSFCLGWFFVGEKMINSSQRFDAYRVFMRYLLDNGRAVLGYGLGSNSVYARTIQVQSKFMLEMTPTGIKGWVWEWLHSDFLQNFIELGFVGGILAILIYLYALKRSYKPKEDPCLFSLGLGLGGAAALNYPCRYFVTAFLLTYFFVEALDLEKPTQVETLGLASSS